MSKQYLYIPTSLDHALSFLRSQRGLNELSGPRSDTIIGYTDRALAVLRHVQQGHQSESREVCLVVVELEPDVMGHILNGDMVHFGPCAKWHSDHALEMDLTAQMLISHGGRFSLQIVKS